MGVDPRLARWFEIDATVSGRPAAIGLAMPPAGQDLPLLIPDDVPAYDAAARRRRMGLVIAAYVKTIDGAPFDERLRRAITADDGSLTALLGLRAKMLDAFRHEGRVFVDCPHCRAGEAELTIAAYAIGLRRDPWPLAGATGEPVSPSLAALWRAGTRPAGVLRAAGARLVFPSGRAGIPGPVAAGALGEPITLERDREARARWDLDGKEFPPGKAHWRFPHPGFRAIMRLAIAFARLDETGDIAPETIETLPMCDVVFADTAYHFLHNVDVVEPDAITVTCPACRGRFLAVR